MNKDLFDILLKDNSEYIQENIDLSRRSIKFNVYLKSNHLVLSDIEIVEKFLSLNIWNNIEDKDFEDFDMFFTSIFNNKCSDEILKKVISLSHPKNCNHKLFQKNDCFYHLPRLYRKKIISFAIVKHAFEEDMLDINFDMSNAEANTRLFYILCCGNFKETGELVKNIPEDKVSTFFVDFLNYGLEKEFIRSEGKDILEIIEKLSEFFPNQKDNIKNKSLEILTGLHVDKNITYYHPYMFIDLFNYTDAGKEESVLVYEKIKNIHVINNLLLLKEKLLANKKLVSFLLTHAKDEKNMEAYKEVNDLICEVYDSHNLQKDILGMKIPEKKVNKLKL